MGMGLNPLTVNTGTIVEFGIARMPLQLHRILYVNILLGCSL